MSDASVHSARANPPPTRVIQSHADSSRSSSTVAVASSVIAAEACPSIRCDLGCEVVAPALGGARRASQPFVEARFRHFQQAHIAVTLGAGGRPSSALGCGGLRGDERVFVSHRCSLTKYAAAFFRNAFSISSSRLRRSISRSRARSVARSIRVRARRRRARRRTSSASCQASFVPGRVLGHLRHVGVAGKSQRRESGVIHTTAEWSR